MKRSPILGYNHNVRYRGLVFHVQTEDSGVLSPHLFTHLFHAGVIVSTRKLVYDAGSAEEAIKALMQAQHKAVLKDLKKGSFDDKIDQYLGGTPGLLPRGAADEQGDVTEPDRGSQPVLARPAAEEIVDVPSGGARTEAEIALSREPTIAMGRERTLEDPAIGLRPTEEAVEQRLPARTKTAERASKAAQVRTSLPAIGGLGGGGSDAELDIDALDQTVRVEALAESSGELLLKLIGEQAAAEVDDELDEDDLGAEAAGPAAGDPRPRRRSNRDTDIAPLDDHTRPTLDISTAFSDGIPGTLPVPPPLRTPNDVPLPPVTQPAAAGQSGPAEATPPSIRAPGSRASTAVGASALPPARPIARPASRPSIVPPQVVSRPLPAEEKEPGTGPGLGKDKKTPSSDAVEVYAPAPPSVELPPHANAPERPGQYSQHKKINARIPVEEPRDPARQLHPQQGSAPTSSAPPTRSSSTAIPAVPPPRAPAAVPPPVPARSGSGPQLVVPTPSSGPPTRPGGPPPAPAPARTASQVAITPPPAPQARTATPPAGVPVAQAKPVSKPVPVPPGRSATNGPAAANGPAAGEPVKPRAPTQTPAAGVPSAVVATAPTAPASSPVPVAVAAGGSASAAQTQPTPARTASVGSPSGAVVVTRPAVIVGAPVKSGPATQRIRKAREDEGGRGFGQGLISEKSLDEVILAYLSEDAEDK